MRQRIKFIPKIGDVGSDVRLFQQRLNLQSETGPLIVEDGIFGKGTEKKLKAVQLKKIVGSKGTGTIGPATLAILGLEVIPDNPVTGGAALTRKLAGTGRTLHPTLRLMIENRVAPKGVWPKAFVERDHKKMVIVVAEALEAMEIREVGGNNRGKNVGLIQAIIGPHMEKGTGDAWCASTVQVIAAFIEDYLQVRSPLAPSEGVTDMWNRSQGVGIAHKKAIAGSFFAWKKSGSWQGHTGVVLGLLPKNKMRTFEGNTGDSSMRDGDGAYFRERSQGDNGNMLIQGYLVLYPTDIVKKAA